jgi:hypothetical protein
MYTDVIIQILDGMYVIIDQITNVIIDQITNV